VSRSVHRTEAGIETITGPPPLGDGVRVRVTSAGICGSDLHAVADGRLPVVLGHEFGGWTDDGTLVAVMPYAPCGSCAACARGDEQLCPTGTRAFHGGTRDGGLADEVLVDPRCPVPVPAGVDPEAVALVEPLAVAVHAVNRASSGERALVIGGGSIGLLCAAVLADRGRGVDLLARHPAQIRAAEAIGAGTTATGRYPVVIDAAGTASSMDQAVRAVVRGGRVVLVALPWEPVSVGVGLVLKEVSVLPAVYYSRAEFEDAAELLGRHPELPAQVVTHRFGLDDAASAFAVAGDRAAGAIKVHLLP
jgi:threonine dehydrogenase-like Zn-dependent dehydrogenase